MCDNNELKVYSTKHYHWLGKSRYFYLGNYSKCSTVLLIMFCLQWWKIKISDNGVEVITNGKDDQRSKERAKLCWAVKAIIAQRL